MLCTSRMHRASQGNSFSVLLNGLLAELPAILDSFLPVPQVIT